MAKRDPASELPDLLARGKVGLSAAGEGIIYAERTAKRDGSVGLRLVPREEGARRQHFQAIFSSREQRFQVLHADEDRATGTAERHTSLIDVRLANLSTVQDATKKWLLDLLRLLLGVARFAGPVSLREERFIVADTDAIAAFLSDQPTTKRHGKHVVDVDAEPIMGMLQVVDGPELLRRRTVGGRLVRHRGRLVVSHAAMAHEMLDVVAFLPLDAVLDALPGIQSLLRIFEEAGARIVGSRLDDVSDLRARVTQLAHLPEVLCRRGILSRSSFGVSATMRQQPGIDVLPSEAEELLQLIEAEMADEEA